MLLSALMLLNFISFAAGAVPNKKLDLVFVIDTTGSMSDEIAQVKADMKTYLNRLQSSDNDYRIAIVDYRDFSDRSSCSSEDYPYRVQLDFTNDYSTINASISALSLGNGGDTNETIYSALADGLDSLSWRKNAAKAVILMGDAPALDPEPYTGYTLDSTVEKLGGEGVEITEPDEIRSIVVFAVTSATSSETTSFFEQLATATGGKCYSTSSTTQITEIMDQILSIDIPDISHVFSEWSVERAPTCVEAGLKSRACTHCDLVETDEILPLGHVFGEWQVSTPATCTESGVERRDCSRCDAFETRELNALGHAPKPYSTASTCSENGFTITICQTCGETLQTVILSRLDHTWNAGEVTLAPTCTEKGVRTYTCTGCGETKTEPVDLLEHEWDEGKVTKEPTCTEAGEMTFTCATGKETRTEPIDKLDHEFQLVNGRAPTCAEIGLTDGWKCKNCDKWFVEQQEISRLAHTPGEVVIENKTAPTCTEDGGYDSVTYCTVCTQEASREHTVEKALGHTPAEPVKENETAPTCGEAGSYEEVVYCETCKAELSRETKDIPATGNHTGGTATCTTKAVCSVCGQEYGEFDANNHPDDQIATIKPAKEPTCGENGTKAILYCNDCKKVIQNDDVIPATGAHTLGTAATCTTKAVCSVCKMSYGEVDPNNHQSIVTDPAKQATCAETGLTEGSHCEACKVIITPQETVPLAAHTPKNISYAATCTTEGVLNRVECTVCKAVLDKGTVLPAAGHAWGNWQYPSGFNCINGGTAKRTCTACGKTETKTLPPDGHAYTLVAKTEPTCTSEGKATYQCESCGISYSESIPMLDHFDHDNDGFCDDCGSKMPGGSECKYCGETHEGFGGFFVGLFHSILALFGLKK